jgi:hypothetical protein
MFATLTEPQLTVPATETSIFTVQGPAAQARSVTIENLDATNTLTYRYQYSSDGTNWTDVQPNATISPGGRFRTTLSGNVFYRLLASGNLSLAAKVEADADFNGTFTVVNV